MASPTQLKSPLEDDKEREQRLANLSGAMAIARLAHQVKELELETDKRQQLTKPAFKPFNCIIDVGVLISMLDGVKRWSTVGGVNVVVPLTVLDELDKLKRGTESINAKTRLSIRYLDGKTKIRSRLNRNTTTSDEPSGTLRIQTSEELFSSWEECEKLMKVTAPEDHERKVIPRHLRGMINCAVFQRSHGIESTIVTDDSDLVSFAKRWGIMTMTGNDLDAMSSRSLENYRNELEAYEARGHNAARHSLPQRRALWAPPKK